ncbi:NAD(P)/FAD-dependent oxidoreductase, partial [Bacillus velezensis]
NEDSTAAMMKGLIQYYRETAHYNEAIYQWADRLGLVHIREMLFEEDMRTQLLKNLRSDISLLQNLSAGKTPYERMKLFD